jgi:hypothetical protein
LLIDCLFVRCFGGRRIIEALLEKDTLDGDEVLAIVEAHACKEDLESRAEATREMAFM